MTKTRWIILAALLASGCMVSQPTEVVEQTRSPVEVEKQAY